MFKARLYGAMRHGRSWDPQLMVAWIINPWKGIQIISRVEPKRWLGEDGFGGVDLGISENRMGYPSHEPIISDDPLDFLVGYIHLYTLQVGINPQVWMIYDEILSHHISIYIIQI